VTVVEMDAEAGGWVVEEILAAGGDATLLTVDVRDDDGGDEIVRRTIERFGRVDALVNNAGIVRDRSLVKMTTAEWDDVIGVHLRGHFVATQAVCRHWREAGAPGHVVCTTSTAGLYGNFGQANYAAAKAGIAAFTSTVAWEMARYPITCNAIAPAARTRMTAALLSSATDDGFDFWAPENVAPLVAYLCSDGSAGVSGKVFGVQGDSIELFQPASVVGEIVNGRERWTAEAVGARLGGLFASADVEPAAVDPMTRLTHRPS
jgi:NAD(P)-dependent dehydrogenase (short-subunit alcohol dehydrogenase family)